MEDERLLSYMRYQAPNLSLRNTDLAADWIHS